MCYQLLHMVFLTNDPGFDLVIDCDFAHHSALSRSLLYFNVTDQLFQCHKLSSHAFVQVNFALREPSSFNLFLVIGLLHLMSFHSNLRIFISLFFVMLPMPFIEVSSVELCK
jgi:hypothetical protein